MRRIFKLTLTVITFLLLLTMNARSQSCAPTGINGTVVNLSCTQTCTNMLFHMPHLKSTSSYAFNTIPYNPLAYVVATGGTEDPTLYADDQFSDVFNLPFQFCYYDSVYTKAVVGSNGCITFDTTNAACSDEGYVVTSPIPFAGGSQCTRFSCYYPKASINGFFSDIDPDISQGPADRKIQWRVEGTAPCRKFVVSYFHCGTFVDACLPVTDPANLNTFQMVLYESTGIIDVYIENKSCNSTTNNGNAVLGIQNWQQTQGVAAPGKNNSVWTAHNEGFRFTPNGGASRFVSCGLYMLDGTFVAPADTSTTTVGVLDIGFPNICPAATTTYVIKTIFSACPSNVDLVSYDTVTIVHINNLLGATTMTPTCGASATVGTITATVTGGTGTPPFTYTLNPGGVTNNTGVFTGLGAGTYTIDITDVVSCPVTLTETVTVVTTLAGTAATTPTACTGVNNGTITLTPEGLAPYTFTLTGPGGPYTQSSPIFTNLTDGTYNATYVNGVGCNGAISNIIVNSGGTLSASSTTNNTSCAGATDGTMTVIPDIAGSHTFTIAPPPATGPATNTTGIFTNLGPNTYTVTFTNTATSCSGTETATVTVGGAILATWCHVTSPTCVGHNETCPGANDGVIVVKPNTPGTYTFTITPAPGVGPATNTTGIFAGISPGVFYSVSFVNATGCTGSMTTLFVQAATAVNATPAHTDATCPGVNDGTITITPTPTGTYTYTLTPGGTVNTTGVFTGLGANTYSVNVTNAGGCGTTVNSIPIITGSGATATAVPANATCPGVGDGTITITPPATGAPFIYTLNPGAVVQNNNPVFTGLTPGTYTITFTTAAGCSGTLTTNPVVGVGAAPTAIAVPANSTCPGADDGTITITPPAAGGPFIYTLNPGAVVQNNNPVFTGLTPGTYTITFTNAAGCNGTVTTNPVIGVGAAPTATAVPTPATCPGVNNGTITITPPATGAPFVYTLNPGNSVQNNNPVFTGLAGGTYTITFTNSFGCSGTVLTNPVVGTGAAPTATAVPANATCPGINDGTITITPPAVGGPFIYTLNPGAVVHNNNPVYTGLATGTYTITFTNAAGCAGTVSPNPTVGAGSNPTTTAVPANATCPGVDDGTITVNPPVTGGPFVYTLNPGNIVQNNNPVFTGLATGTYTITFTTSVGCIGTVSPTTVGAGSTPTASSVPTSATCPGVNDGTLTVTPPPTGGPFVYTLNPGNVVQNNNPVFTGLATGTYTITFTTAAGCIGNVNPNPTVGAGSNPTTTATKTNTTCPGVDDGTVTVTPPASGGPFTYTLNPGAITNSTGIFTGLAANTYTITFTTAIGCNGTVTGTQVVAAGPIPTTTASKTNTTCPGVDDGTVTVTPPASGGPFTYTLNPGAITNSTGIFTGLAANTYTITFTTAIGCNGTVPVNQVVAVGAAPTASAVPSSTTCPGVTDGIITVTPPAAGGPFVYTLNPGNIVQNNNPVFTGLAPGTYTITFTTSLGCSGTVAGNIVLLAGPALTANAPTVGNPPCAFINDGTLTIVPSLAGVYTYVLNPGSPGQVTQFDNPLFTGLAPGNYTYTFTNASGCIGSGNATLTTHAPLAIDAVLTMPLCYGNTDGIITLSASGGLATYQYALSPFTTYQGGTFNGLTQGTYTFRVKDAAGCTKDTTIILNQPTQLTATAVTAAGTCNGNDGQILVTGHAGTPYYTYSTDGITFQPASSFVVSGASSPGAVFANITVKDNNGCLATAPTVYVGLVDNMAPLVIGNDTTICAEQHVTFQPQVSPQATVFTWSTIPDPAAASTLDNSTILNATATPLDTTSYVLNAQWGVCSRIDTIKISVLHKPIPNAGQDTAVCFDKAIATLHGTASNLSGTVNYEWSDTTNLVTPHNAVTVANPHATETFVLTVTDNYGCNFSVTDQVVVIVQPPVPAFAGNDTIAVIGEPHQLNATGGVSYTWLPANDLNFSNIPNPLATLNHDQLFQVTVTDAAGCVGYDKVYVQVYPGPGFQVPNAFTPNGDGLNDIFRVIPVGISYTEWFRIFNRYGQLVFETNQYLKGWDGTFQGKKQPIGNYVWVLKGRDKNNKVVEMKGTVLIVQ